MGGKVREEECKNGNGEVENDRQSERGEMEGWKRGN